MKHIIPILSVLFFICFISGSCQRPEASAQVRKPNVIFILADDPGWSDTDVLLPVPNPDYFRAEMR